jgi:hypothetical protein
MIILSSWGWVEGTARRPRRVDCHGQERRRGNHGKGKTRKWRPLRGAQRQSILSISSGVADVKFLPLFSLSLKLLNDLLDYSPNVLFAACHDVALTVTRSPASSAGRSTRAERRARSSQR